jgi:hypothetical protein
MSGLKAVAAVYDRRTNFAGSTAYMEQDARAHLRRLFPQAIGRGHAVFDAELSVDALKMLFHCLLDATENLPHFPVRFALAHPVHDFPFARREE